MWFSYEKGITKMAVNLLPSDLTVPVTVNKLKKNLYNWSVVLGIVLLVGIASMTVFFFLRSSELKKTNADISTLKTQVSSLEKTEQQLVLVKDRLEKIKRVQDGPSVVSEVQGIREIYSNVTSLGGTIGEADIKPDSIELTLSVADRNALKSILDFVINNDLFVNINMSSMAFLPNYGYSTSLLLTTE